MADPVSATDTAITAATHVAAGGGGLTLAGLWNRWRSEKRDERLEKILQDQNVTLALLQQSVKGLTEKLERQEAFGERLALVEQAVRAAHSRVDDLERGRRRR